MIGPDGSSKRRPGAELDMNTIIGESMGIPNIRCPGSEPSIDGRNQSGGDLLLVPEGLSASIFRQTHRGLNCATKHFIACT